LPAVFLDAAARLARLLPPETAHRAAVCALEVGAARMAPPMRPEPTLAVDLAGLRLPNVIGLAAGFDKDARAVDGCLALGFGFVEVGAVTPRPQPGNPRPRVFRLTEDRAVINRYGFNSEGVDAVARRLAARRARGGVVGVNLGANKDSKDPVTDYIACLERLWGLADFFTINVSSPNTPGLRDLQRTDALGALLTRVMSARADFARGGAGAPVFLKVAPDLSREGVVGIAQAALATGISGIIVSNTTVARPQSLKSPLADEMGGLSGRPLFHLSTALLADFRRATGGRLPLIGVGGVEDAETAYAKIRAGASAVQLYTAMVYAGPGVVRRIVQGLAALLKRDGLGTAAEAVGSDVAL
jgi:dihydroorotate dehydrogenase